MDYDSAMHESELLNGKDRLLRKCKSTIQALEAEIESYKVLKIDLERKLRESQKIQCHFQGDLEEKDYEINSLSKELLYKDTQYEQLSRKNLELQQEKENFIAKLEKMNELLKSNEDEKLHQMGLISNLNNELSHKIGLLSEWNSTMVEIDQKIAAAADEKKIYQRESEIYYIKCQELIKENKELNDLWNDLKKKSESVQSEHIKEIEYSSKKIKELEIANSELLSKISISKDEIANLVNASSLLQGQHKSLKEKLKKQKKLTEEKNSEVNKLNFSLSKFEEKLKVIESNSVRDMNNLKKDNEQVYLEQQSELEKKDRYVKEKIEEMVRENTRKNDELAMRYESQIMSLKQETMRIKEEYTSVLYEKEEEILVLNSDRSKLQHALEEMELKIIEISKNLENSVVDCWKLSNEAIKLKSSNEEVVKLNSYYKNQFQLREQDFNKKYSERLKEKMIEFQEKISEFKQTFRKELETLALIINNNSTETNKESLVVIQKMLLMLSNFI